MLFVDLQILMNVLICAFTMDGHVVVMVSVPVMVLTHLVILPALAAMATHWLVTVK